MTIPDNKFNNGDELFFIDYTGAIRKGRVSRIEYFKVIYPDKKKNLEWWSYEFQYKDKKFYPYLIKEHLCSENVDTLAEGIKN